jgi:hypothetical protein
MSSSPPPRLPFNGGGPLIKSAIRLLKTAVQPKQPENRQKYPFLRSFYPFIQVRYLDNEVHEPRARTY